jgi:hypothetical protein
MAQEIDGADTRADVRSAAKVGVLLVGICSVFGLIATVGSPPHLLASKKGLVIPIVLGLIVTPLALRLMWTRMTWNLLYFAAILAVGGFALASYYAGPRIQVGVMLFVILAIYASYYFSLLRAVSIVGLIGVAWAVQLALQPGNEAPVIRWIYVIGILIVSVTFVNSLVRVAERSARREKKARDAEKTARLELAELNQALEEKVADQVTEMERLSRLRRFLSPNLAESLFSSSTSEASRALRLQPNPKSFWRCSASSTRSSVQHLHASSPRSAPSKGTG